MKIFNTRFDMVRDLLSDGYVGAELGVLNGSFSQELIVLNPSVLYLVDIWSGNFLSGDVNGNNLKNWDLNKCYEDLNNKYSTKNNVKIKKQSSCEFLKECPDNYFDFIYIDTVHDYENTILELNYAWPKIKQNGFIAGHDFDLTDKCNHKFNFGVDKAVYEFCLKNNKKIHALACDGCMSFAIQK